MTWFGFRSAVGSGFSFSMETRNGVADVSSMDRFLTFDGLLAKTRIRQLRPARFRRLPNPEILLFRSISPHGLRMDHLSEKPSRPRNMPPWRDKDCKNHKELDCKDDIQTMPAGKRAIVGWRILIWRIFCEHCRETWRWANVWWLCKEARQGLQNTPSGWAVAVVAKYADLWASNHLLIIFGSKQHILLRKRSSYSACWHPVAFRNFGRWGIIYNLIVSFVLFDGFFLNCFKFLFIRVQREIDILNHCFNLYRFWVNFKFESKRNVFLDVIMVDHIYLLSSNPLS